MSVLTLRTEDGSRIGLNLHRWLQGTSEVDENLLERAAGPVLDVGCGPGRHVEALSERGVVAMGVDASAHAVEIARRRGVAALHRSVFDPLPGTGRWGTLLMLDGSIGIGGNPAALLRRGVELLRRGGLILAELEPPGTPSRSIRARLESSGTVTPWFPWALVGVDAAGSLARHSGMRLEEIWSGGTRWFVRLTKP